MSAENVETSLDPKVAAILQRYPFLSYGTMLDQSYLGIIQNSDTQLLSIYVITDMPTRTLRQAFLAYGEEWWYGSNRAIPINIFFKQSFLPFRPYLKHFNRKEFKHLAGPTVSLAEAIGRRVRKRQVTLVRKIID